MFVVHSRIPYGDTSQCYTNTVLREITKSEPKLKAERRLRKVALCPMISDQVGRARGRAPAFCSFRLLFGHPYQNVRLDSHHPKAARRQGERHPCLPSPFPRDSALNQKMTKGVIKFHRSLRLAGPISKAAPHHKMNLVVQTD